MATNTQLNTGTIPVVVKTTTLTLSSANIMSMFTTPIQIIAAQGSHTYIIVHNVFTEYIFNTNPYADGDNLIIQYGNVGSEGSSYILFYYTNFILQNTQSAFDAENGQSGRASFAVAGVVNQGLYITNATAPYTGGDSTAKVTVLYSVLTTTS